MQPATALTTPAPTIGPLKLLPPGRIVAEATEPGQVLTLDDLSIGSRYLAGVMNHKPDVAVGHPESWYGEQWGSDCPPAQASVLRRMTIEHCEQQAVLERYQAGITDPDVERRIRAGERLNGASFLLLMVWLLVVGSLLLNVSTPGPDELGPQPLPVAAPAVSTL